MLYLPPRCLHGVYKENLTSNEPAKRTVMLLKPSQISKVFIDSYSDESQRLQKSSKNMKKWRLSNCYNMTMHFHKVVIQMFQCSIAKQSLCS
jgi:hypothetical protein